MDKKRPEFKVTGLAIDCKDANALGEFYRKLLGWEKTHEDEVWYALASPMGITLAFQNTPEYQPPVWPYKDGEQGQMLHLDFLVDDLNSAVEYAIELGATVATAQFYEEYDCKTMIDPEGHPFCIATRTE